MIQYFRCLWRLSRLAGPRPGRGPSDGISPRERHPHLHGNTNGRAYFSVMKDKLRRDLLCLAAIAAVVLAVYLPGLGNPLVFDDAYLVDKLKDEHGTLRLQVRMLSYGSFLWLMDLFGQGWWKQRLVNIVLHLGTVAALAGLYREILRAIEPAPAAHDPAHAARVPYEESPAFWVAIGVFALNPVATYAIAYLIQRSILMATLFVALALWLFARGLRLRQPLLFGAAFVAYVFALASKEHAILAPLAAVPIYILIARPSATRLLSLAGAGARAGGHRGLRPAAVVRRTSSASRSTRRPRSISPSSRS